MPRVENKKLNLEVRDSRMANGNQEVFAEKVAIIRAILDSISIKPEASAHLRPQLNQRINDLQGLVPLDQEAVNPNIRLNRLTLNVLVELKNNLEKSEAEKKVNNDVISALRRELADCKSTAADVQVLKN